jgi:hypothetical protein
MSDKIRATHLERRAVVYLRQSTLRQVHEQGESTARQYALRQRALELSWAAERIDLSMEEAATVVPGSSGAVRSFRAWRVSKEPPMRGVQAAHYRLDWAL